MAEWVEEVATPARKPGSIVYVRRLGYVLFWLSLVLFAISLFSQGASFIAARGATTFPEPLAITIALRLGTFVAPLALLALAGVLIVLCEIHDRLAEQLELIGTTEEIAGG